MYTHTREVTPLKLSYCCISVCVCAFLGHFLLYNTLKHVHNMLGNLNLTKLYYYNITYVNIIRSGI